MLLVLLIVVVVSVSEAAALAESTGQHAVRHATSWSVKSAVVQARANRLFNSGILSADGLVCLPSLLDARYDDILLDDDDVGGRAPGRWRAWHDGVGTSADTALLGFRLT